MPLWLQTTISWTSMLFSQHFLSICFAENIWSIVDFPSWNPFWYSPAMFFGNGSSLFSMNITNHAFPQSSDIISSNQIMCMSSWSLGHHPHISYLLWLRRYFIHPWRFAVSQQFYCTLDFECGLCDGLCSLQRLVWTLKSIGNDKMPVEATAAWYPGWWFDSLATTSRS